MGNEPRDDPRSPLEAFKDAAVLIFSAFVLIQLFIWVDPREFREIGDDGSCEVSGVDDVWNIYIIFLKKIMIYFLLHAAALFVVRVPSVIRNAARSRIICRH